MLGFFTNDYKHNGFISLTVVGCWQMSIHTTGVCSFMKPNFLSFRSLLTPNLPFPTLFFRSVLQVSLTSACHAEDIASTLTTHFSPVGSVSLGGFPTPETAGDIPTAGLDTVVWNATTSLATTALLADAASTTYCPPCRSFGHYLLPILRFALGCVICGGPLLEIL